MHLLYKQRFILTFGAGINFLSFPFLLRLLLYLPQCISLVVLGREERGKRERGEGEKLRLFYSKLRHVHHTCSRYEYTQSDNISLSFNLSFYLSTRTFESDPETPSSNRTCL